MIIHDFDNETEPLISLRDFYGEPKHIVRKCLILFSVELHQYLLDNFPCKEISAFSACNGPTPIYQFDYKGQPLAFYLSAIGSAQASTMCYEAHWLTGADQFVMFGSCGSLDSEKTHGHFILPTESYRGEGCSYYYAPASDYITVNNSNKLASIFTELNVPFVQGRVWTTDSMLRETKGLVQRRKSEGCIAVEMELAGVQAICDFFDLQLYDFLEAGDVLSEYDYDKSGLSAANHNTAKLLIALETALRV